MVSYVKNLMVVGKSLIILITSFALVGCGATTGSNYNNSVSTYASTQADYHNVNSSVLLAVNYVNWQRFRMDPYDRKQQEQAVFFALNNLKPGEETNWYNGNTGAKGRVRVVMSYPQGSGYCRTIQSELSFKGKNRSFQETACINSVDNNWRFVR